MTLGVVPEGEAVGVQRLLCLWAAEARAQGGGPADGVDGHVVKPSQVERDHGGEAFGVGPRAHATDDTRTAAERHDRDTVLRTHVSTAATSPAPPGTTTPSGALDPSPVRSRYRSG